LLLTDDSGNGVIFDVLTQTTVPLPSGRGNHISAAEWDYFASTRFYVATTEGRFTILTFSGETIDSIASFDFTFPIHFIRVSPFNSHSLIVANKDGTFSHIDLKTGAHDPGGLFLKVKNLIDASFHPFLPNAIFFVFTFQILLLFRDSNTAIPIHPNANPNEALIASYFPDPASEQAALLVYRSHARFMRGHAHPEPVQIIKYLSAVRQCANHARCTAFFGGKLYVAGSGGSLQVFALRGSSFWGVHILRGAPSRIADFAVGAKQTVFGCAKGVVVGYDSAERRSGWPPATFYHFFQTAVTHVCEVSADLFVVVTAVDGRNRVFFWNAGRKCVKSMLTHALAALEGATVDISVSSDRRYVAVLIDFATLAFFRIENEIR
jgi:hypothetical protein